jgi:hypothetical protein
VIVFKGDVRDQSGNSEFLEQMSLPQVADIVINPAGFAPIGHRPDVDGEDDDETEPAENFQKLHHSIRRGPVDAPMMAIFAVFAGGTRCAV